MICTQKSVIPTGRLGSWDPLLGLYHQAKVSGEATWPVRTNSPCVPFLAASVKLTSSTEMPSRARTMEVGASGGLPSLQASSRLPARRDQASARLVLAVAWDMLAPHTSCASRACSSSGTCTTRNLLLDLEVGCVRYSGLAACAEWNSL